MNQEQTLEMQIHAKSQEAIQSLNKLISSLTGVEKQVDDISKNVNKVSTKNAVNQMNNLDNSINKVSKNMKTFKNLFTFAGAKRLGKTMLSWMDEAVDQTEQLNLFNVVFDNIEKNGTQMYSNLGKQATKFQYKLNEAFGTNKTQTFYMQGIFQSMGETVEIPDNYSAIMSETMTKLTFDLASLYNKTETTTAEAIRAGVYAGQTKPLRSFGIDVTQMSMQPILDSLGIDRQVKEMSQAEKEILRYLATLKQSQIAMGDLANTIESPSNQMKIFRQQLVETKVAISSLFIGTFANALPWANAFLMVVKEISKAIADMFGIKLSDYNTGIASNEDAFVDLGDSVDDAIGKVKELKRQTLGFDEIHNINENTDSGSGLGNISGGIDQRLLDAIKGYDNGMESIRMKASQIRDDIMKWLGFTKEIDPLTGEVKFKFQGIKTLLKNVLKSWKDTSITTKVIMGLGLVAGLTNTYKIGNKIYKLLGGSGITQTIKGLFSPMKSLYSALDNVNFANKTLNQGLAEGITNWSKSLTAVDKFKVGLIGIIGLTTSMEGISSAMKSVSNEGWNLGNSLQTVASGLGSMASGAYIGSIFGPMGTAIGGVTGALIGLNEIYMKMPTEVSKTNDALKEKHKSLQAYLDTVRESNKAIEESLNQELTVTGVHKTLVTELETLIDKNGEVKEGYESRAKFIIETLNNAYGLEIEIINGKIQNYDKEIGKIKEVIKQKEAEILLNANQEKYAKALQEENTLWMEKEKAIESTIEAENNVALAQKEYNEAYDAWVLASANGTVIALSQQRALKKKRDALNAANDALNTARNDEKEATDEYVENQKIIIDYSVLSQAVISGNYAEIEEAIKQYVSTYKTEVGYEQMTLTNRLKKTREDLGTMLEIYKDCGDDVLNAIRSQYASIEEETLESLLKQSQYVEDIKPDIAEAWYTLGQLNKDKFMEKFQEIPKDVQQKVVDEMYNKGYLITDELKKGIETNNPEIHIKTKVDKATVKVDADTSQAEKKTNNWLGNLFGSLGKYLGFREMGGAFYGNSWHNISQRANGGVFTGTTWKNISQYAYGGIPSHGTMFVAGEAGAEIVGHINGRTEVLNQSQIASAIYSAVYSAMSQFNGGGVAEINVRAEKGVIVETAINGIQQHVNQTGNLPFTIPIN